jgi:hypothetical protein
MPELDANTNSRMTGRVQRVVVSPHEHKTLIVRADGPRLVGRNRFFAHEADFDPSYMHPETGDLVEFLPAPPNKLTQLPKAVCVLLLEKAKKHSAKP